MIVFSEGRVMAYRTSSSLRRLNNNAHRVVDAPKRPDLALFDDLASAAMDLTIRGYTATQIAAAAKSAVNFERQGKSGLWKPPVTMRTNRRRSHRRRSRR